MKQGVIVQWSIPGDRISSFIEIVLEASPMSVSAMHVYDDSAASSSIPNEETCGLLKITVQSVLF